MKAKLSNDLGVITYQLHLFDPVVFTAILKYLHYMPIIDSLNLLFNTYMTFKYFNIFNYEYYTYTSLLKSPPPSLLGLEHIACIPCKEVRLSFQKRAVLGITLDCIWWQGSNFKDQGSMEYSFIAITPIFRSN